MRGSATLVGTAVVVATLSLVATVAIAALPAPHADPVTTSKPARPAPSPQSRLEPESRDSLPADRIGASSLIEASGTQGLRVDRTEPEDEAAPSWLRVDALDLVVELVTAGVDRGGVFDVPATAVGWYQFGPRPGETGSAVLAAHVDFNGRPGAFSSLHRLVPGDRIEIGDADGTVTIFEVVDQRLYDKAHLPAGELFRQSGASVLRLITCGGSFDATARSYRGNRVVTAVPVDVRSGSG